MILKTGTTSPKALLLLGLLAPLLITHPGAAWAQQPLSIHLPAQPLDQAIIELARQTGLSIGGDASLLQGKQAPALSGEYTPEAALHALLAGSGITVTRGASGYKLERIPQQENTLEAVSVYGRQKNDTVAAIPQSVNVYTRENFELAGAQTVGEVIRLTPSANRSGSGRDMFADDFLIRGFNAEQSVNGLGFRQTDHPTDLANVERLEVLKGPASVLYGQMEPGGTINVVTKQPLSYYQAEATAEYGRYDYRRTTLDVTGPLNDRVRARLNLAYQDSDASMDFWEYERVFVAPNVTVDLTDTTNLTVEGSYSGNEWTAIPGGAPAEGAFLPNPNGHYSDDFNTAWRDSFTERDSFYINSRLTQAITDTIDARISYAYTRNDADWQEYAPFGLNADERTLNRIIFAGDDTYKKDHEIILDLSGEFSSGPLTHKFIAGVNYRESDASRPTRIYLADAIDLYSPVYGPADLSADNLIRDRGFDQSDRILAGFVQDRITVADNWHVLAGLRYTDAEQSQKTIDFLDNNSVTRAELGESAWTTQFGLVYDLTDTASLYASRNEAFVPQQGTTSGKQPLDAEESVQYETGVRFTAGRLNINAAGFIIEKDNIAIADPLDDDFEVARGRARSKGAELTIDGYASANLYLSAGYGYTDTEVLRSDDEALEGNRFINVPLHTASLQGRYFLDTVTGLSLGGTVSYVDQRPGDSENTFTLPSHTRVDLGAYYAVTDALQLDLLVNNALDEEIFSPGSFDGVIREEGRTWLARVKYLF
ncbi:TonB-dependent siderophore receptor [Alloalcanivorax xenomutans]|uniref:TonB-dependent siderophore receptor n=1 Tax=Alloalcanivorax xenomutans TaxID=1094342 RepID=UPI003BAA5F92